MIGTYISTPVSLKDFEGDTLCVIPIDSNREKGTDDMRYFYTVKGVTPEGKKFHSTCIGDGDIIKVVELYREKGFSVHGVDALYQVSRATSTGIIKVDTSRSML